MRRITRFLRLTLLPAALAGAAAAQSAPAADPAQGAANR